jgi:hypothetical protein
MLRLHPSIHLSLSLTFAFPLVPIEKFSAFLHILYNSSFTYHPFIRRYIVRVTEKVSLNKQHINYAL